MVGKFVFHFSNDWKIRRGIFPMVGNFSNGWETGFATFLLPLFLLSTIFLAGTGCFQGQENCNEVVEVDPLAFNAENAMQEVAAFIQIYPRDAGTPGAKKAAFYLCDRMRALGIEAFVDEFEDQTPVGIRPFYNVIGRIPGRGNGTIIIGSHFDSKVDMPAGFSGANDSGSSSGILLELGRVLATYTNLKPEILLVHFDGEECMQNYSPQDGFHGSKYFVEQLQQEGRVRNILAFILLDMAGDRDYTMTIPQNCTPFLTKYAFDAAREEGVRNQFKLSPFSIGDDHVAFFEAGIPAVNLIDFEFGSAPGKNDYWHTGEDSLDKLSTESLGYSGRITLRILNRLMNQDNASN